MQLSNPGSAQLSRVCEAGGQTRLSHRCPSKGGTGQSATASTRGSARVAHSNPGGLQGGEGQVDAVCRAVLGGKGDGPDGGVVAGAGEGGGEVPVHWAKRGTQAFFSCLCGQEEAKATSSQ